MPFGRRPPPTPLTPPRKPGGGLPIVAIQAALDAAIQRISQAMLRYHVGGGQLLRDGNTDISVRDRLGESLCFEQDGQPSFAVFYATENFKQLSCLPHYRLFIITSALGFADELMGSIITPDLAEQIASTQLLAPLMDAHMMKCWLGYAVPSGNALATGDMEAFAQILRLLRSDLSRLALMGPREPALRAIAEDRAREWGSGWPAIVTLPESEMGRRLNGLPMSKEVDQQIMGYLAEMQGRAMTVDRVS